MKKKQITIIITCLLFISSQIFAQEKPASTSERNGFKIHVMYGSLFLSTPISGLSELVPSTGAGFKWGSIFYFYKPGIAKGLLNFGLQTQYMNFEANVPLSKLGDDTPPPPYSIALAGNLGPVFSVKPTNDVQIDLYYLFGTGFRLFPKNAGLYYEYAFPEDVHTRFTQAAGLGFHYKALYSTIGLQMLNFKYKTYIDNTLKERRKLATLQISVGICGWKIK